ncbi:conserved hypothetical protein [Ricinus communis]|uniref:Uncharacterized protein n=1 Tax=Ricinus communis TaxID=3988 RepID=B9SIG9_RICCO|nr:conserved hypothetical protein [Ricinus communis]
MVVEVFDGCKTGWRFMNFPYALMCKVLKARYFPSYSFLDAEMGVIPSYVWRSVMAAQDLIRGRVRMRVGTGALVNV